MFAGLLRTKIINNDVDEVPLSYVIKNCGSSHKISLLLAFITLLQFLNPRGRNVLFFNSC